MGRRKLEKTKSPADVMKDYRRNPKNRDKISAYEKLRQERRKLERLQKKEKVPKLIVKICGSKTKNAQDRLRSSSTQDQLHSKCTQEQLLSNRTQEQLLSNSSTPYLLDSCGDQNQLSSNIAQYEHSSRSVKDHLPFNRAKRQLRSTRDHNQLKSNCLQSQFSSCVANDGLSPRTPQDQLTPSGAQGQLSPYSAPDQLSPYGDQDQLSPSCSQGQFRPCGTQNLLSSRSAQGQLSHSSPQNELRLSNAEEEVSPTNVQNHFSQNKLNPSSTQYKLSPSCAQYKLSPSSDQGQLSPCSAQNKVSLRSAQYKLSASNVQDRLSLSSAQDKLSPRNAQGQLSPGSAHDKLSPCNDQGQLSPSSDQDKLSPSSDQDKLSPCSAQDKLSPCNAQGQLSPSSDQDKLSPSSDQDRLSPCSAQDKLSPCNAQGQLSPCSAQNKPSFSSARGQLSPSYSQNQLSFSSARIRLSPCSANSPILKNSNGCLKRKIVSSKPDGESCAKQMKESRRVQVSTDSEDQENCQYSTDEDYHPSKRKKSSSKLNKPIRSQKAPVKSAILKSRQAITGEKMRKKNQEELREKLSIQENEMKELKKNLVEKDKNINSVNKENDRLKTKLEQWEEKSLVNEERRQEEDSWFRMIYFDLSPEERRSIKDSIFRNKCRLPRGTLQRLRMSTGVNFSKPPPVPNYEEPEIATVIREYAVRNSSEVPDERANKGNKGQPNERYAIHHLTVLHDDFLSENPDKECSYSTFVRYWPTNIKKPKLSERSSCHCKPCENSAMIVAALERKKLIQVPSNVFKALKLEREGEPEMMQTLLEEIKKLNEGNRKDETIQYTKWEDVEIHMEAEEKQAKIKKGAKLTKKTVPRKRPKTTIVSKFSEKAVEQFLLLKDHLNRNAVMKSTIKEKKGQVLEDRSGTKAMLQVDWSENYTHHENREIQSGFFSTESFSIHTGYCYMYGSSFGFAALSEVNNHKAEGIWSAMEDVLRDLVSQGVLHFIFVSDSPVNQYRNSKLVYFLKEWVRYNGLTAEWFYTEVSHGKSPADSVGGGIKSEIRQQMLFNSTHTINNLEDLLSIVQSQRSYRLNAFGEEDIKRMKEYLPAKLTPLRGAFQIHELQVESSGKVKAKKLPSDPVYMNVDIRGTTNSLPTNRLARPALSSYTEE